MMARSSSRVGISILSSVRFPRLVLLTVRTLFVATSPRACASPTSAASEASTRRTMSRDRPASSSWSRNAFTAGADNRDSFTVPI